MRKDDVVGFTAIIFVTWWWCLDSPKTAWSINQLEFADHLRNYIISRACKNITFVNRCEVHQIEKIIWLHKQILLKYNDTVTSPGNWITSPYQLWQWISQALVLHFIWIKTMFCFTATKKSNYYCTCNKCNHYQDVVPLFFSSVTSVAAPFSHFVPNHGWSRLKLWKCNRFLSSPLNFNVARQKSNTVLRHKLYLRTISHEKISNLIFWCVCDSSNPWKLC